jgi:hypothetical protein
MKKGFFFLLIMVLSMAFRTDVFALSDACTQEEQVRLRQLANATQITYEFYEDVVNDITGFTVTINGFSPDFYVYDEAKGIYFQYKNSTISTSSGFADGQTYVLPFFASDKSPCNGYQIMTKTVALPKYNIYSTDTLCKGHETYELCKKFTSVPIASHKDFVQRLEQYIKNLNKDGTTKPIDEKPQKELTLWQMIGEFLWNNYMFILIPIIVLGTTGIVVIEVKKRRSIL